MSFYCIEIQVGFYMPQNPKRDPVDCQFRPVLQDQEIVPGLSNGIWGRSQDLAFQNPELNPRTRQSVDSGRLNAAVRWCSDPFLAGHGWTLTPGPGLATSSRTVALQSTRHDGSAPHKY